MKRFDRYEIMPDGCNNGTKYTEGIRILLFCVVLFMLIWSGIGDCVENINYIVNTDKHELMTGKICTKGDGWFFDLVNFFKVIIK